MQKLMSLNASGLTDSFSVDIHGEKPVLKVEEKKERIELSYIFPGFSMSDVDQSVGGDSIPFKEVGISGAGFVSESGKPLLPSFGRFVQIPPGCDFTVTEKLGRPVAFKDITVTPAQAKATDGARDEGGFEFDKKAYKENAFYPEKVVDVSEPMVMNNYKVVLVHVRPLQYNAAEKTLRGYSNISVSIKFKAKTEMDESDSNEHVYYDPAANLEGFGNLVVNPRRGISSRVNIEVRAPAILFPYKKGPEFLIIYAESLSAEAKQLALWKNQRGVKTQTISIDSVGNTVAEIKNYIRKLRKSAFSRLRYVLLFGDVNTIVTEETNNNTTDLYYYTSKDAANASDCVLPWVSGGRIPITSADQAQDIVRQIISYERNPPCDSYYYERMAFAAYFQDDNPQNGRADRCYMKTLEGIREHMISEGFDVERIYVSNNPNPLEYRDGTTVSQEVRDSILDGEDATDRLISATAEGSLIISHRDHGLPAGWHEPHFQKDSIENIGSSYPSIFFSINCSTGKFDGNPVDSFAEALLALDGGAPSLIAATELSNSWQNDSLTKGLFDAMWPGVIATFPDSTVSYSVKYNRLGDIFNYANSYLLVAHGTNSGVKDHLEIYHVIGDPTLGLWTKKPMETTLSAKILNKNLRLKLSSCPSNTVITIMDGSKILKRLTPSSVAVSIPLRNLDILSTGLRTLRRRYLSVCFAAPGYRPVIKRVRY